MHRAPLWVDARTTRIYTGLNYKKGARITMGVRRITGWTKDRKYPYTHMTKSPNISVGAQGLWHIERSPVLLMSKLRRHRGENADDASHTRESKNQCARFARCADLLVPVVPAHSGESAEDQEPRSEHHHLLKF